MGQFHFTPEGYLERVHCEVPQYERMQDEVAAACEGFEARAILELGIGTGRPLGAYCSAAPERR